MTSRRQNYRDRKLMTVTRAGGREGLTTKTVLGDFRGNDATVLYPDCDGNYVTVCICQSS